MDIGLDSVNSYDKCKSDYRFTKVLKTTKFIKVK